MPEPDPQVAWEIAAAELQPVVLSELSPVEGNPLRPKTVIDSFAETMRTFGARTFRRTAITERARGSTSSRTRAVVQELPPVPEQSRTRRP
jgi:hypothetical protein